MNLLPNSDQCVSHLMPQRSKKVSGIDIRQARDDCIFYCYGETCFGLYRIEQQVGNFQGCYAGNISKSWGQSILSFTN